MINEFLIDRKAKDDPEGTALLLKVMERPAMYFGATRFDYMQHFLSGYDFVRWENNVNSGPSYQLEWWLLEYWLLHTQSATFHGSLNGFSLFTRCFGCGQEAFDAYRVFLNTSFPEKVDSICSELYGHKYGGERNIVRYDWEDDVPADHYQKLAQAVLDHINEIIRRADLIYDQLRVYVCRDSYFVQVRFMLRGESGWTDDSELIANPENHDLLVAIHANAEYAGTEALQNFGIEVFDKDETDAEFVVRQDRPYSETFAFDYERWRKEFFN